MTTIAAFSDGSSVRADDATGALDAQPGLASLALDCAEHAAVRPAVEALAWYRGAAPPGTISARPAGGDSVELRARGEQGVVRIAELRALLAAATEVRLGDESLWLLRADPLACVPSAGDRSFAATLEPRVAAFDEQVRASALGDPREAARRQILLAEVRAAGILDEPLLDRKIEVLAELGTSHLASLATAARALASYYDGPERARWIRRPVPASIHSGALSLDWARAVTWAPAGFTLFEWWAACEDTFLGFFPYDGVRGSTYLLQGKIGAELAWRSEDGTRVALYDATVGPRRPRSHGDTPAGPR